MNPSPNPKRTLNLIGRLALTFVVVCGALGSVFVGSGTAKAIEHIDQTDNALAELSQYIAYGHGYVRGSLITPGSSVDDALVRFGTAVDLRVARLRNLNTLIERQTGAYWWTQPLQGDADVRHFEEQRREYVTAAATTQLSAADDSAMTLRLFDLRAQQLIQTLEGVRDSADTAKARALVASEGVVALSSGTGGLLLAYLIWFPVFGGRKRFLQAARVN